LNRLSIGNHSESFDRARINRFNISRRGDGLGPQAPRRWSTGSHPSTQSRRKATVLK
jgi:hypothetical protein